MNEEARPHRTYTVMRYLLIAFSALLPMLGLNAAPTFTIQGGTLTAVELHGATAVNIPSGVTSIGDNVFMRLTSLRRVSIPNGVTSIGHNAFYGCTSLSEVNIPDGVMTIGDWAFKDCRSLMGISIPSSVTRIGGDAFSGCGFTYTGNYGYGYFAGDYGGTGTGSPNVRWTIRNGELTDVELNGETDITIPSSVTSIGNNAFRYCYNLSSIIIPDSVTSIGSYAFADCHELMSVIVGNGVTRIESGAFSYCNSLSIVMFLGALPDCGNGAFGVVADGCVAYVDASVALPQDGDIWNSLTVRKIPLPRDAASLSRATFTIDHDELTHVALNDATVVMIPGSVTRIRANAFDDCHDLTSMLIPCSVTSIDHGAFRNCYNLTNVVLLASSTSISEPRIPSNMFQDCDRLTSVTIGHGVTRIGDCAFANCHELTSVTIPNSVTSIGERAFEYCSGMTSVTIGNGVTNIGNYAFLTCSRLTSVTIPASVTSIGNGAFAECFDLTSVLFLGNLPDCGSDAFKAVAINVNVGHGCCVAYVDASVASPQDGAIWNNLTVWKIPLPRDADSFSRATFTIRCGELTHVEPNGATLVMIPGSVTCIRHDAFDDCHDMTCVLIPNSVRTIEGGTFRNCRNLANIVMPTSVTSIEDAMFEGCDKLTGVVIPDSVTRIGSDVFSDCSSLTSVTIGKSVTSIGYRAFYGCSELTSVTIPDSMTIIETDTFTGCSSLTNVTIGNSVTCIEDAFRSCYSLRNIVIPNTVRFIWPSAFEGCSGLVSMLFLGDAPPSVGDFHTSSVGCKAYVKSTANGWPAEGEYWNGLEVVCYGGKSAKATIEESMNGYALASNEGETLCEGDIALTAVLNGVIVDTKKGYNVEIAADGKSATARLKTPTFGAAAIVADDDPPETDSSDPTGALVESDGVALSTQPWANDDEEIGALPVAAVPGLYYRRLGVTALTISLLAQRCRRQPIHSISAS